MEGEIQGVPEVSHDQKQRAMSILQSGHSMRNVASVVGISRSTIAHWKAAVGNLPNEEIGKIN